MSSKTYGSMDGFGFKVIATGEFIDEGYLVTAYIVRLSPEALITYRKIWKAYSIPEYLFSKYYDSREEWELYIKENDRLRKEWKDKIKKLIGLEDDADKDIIITANIVEIFTIIIAEEVRK